VPALTKGKTVLVAAHGNSIRGILKHLDAIPDEAVTELEIPTGVPLVYQLDASLKPIAAEGAVAPLSGVFLGNADEIAAARKAVADQTKAAEAAEVQFACMGSGCLLLSSGDMRRAFDEVAGDAADISAAELKTILERLSEGEEALGDAEVNEIFGKVDRNGDGRIDFEEFVQAITAER